MIRLEIDLSDVDYYALIERFGTQVLSDLKKSHNPAALLLSGGISSQAAKAVIARMSPVQREKLATDLVNGNKQKIIAAVGEVARNNGLDGKIRQIHAKQIL